MAESGPFNQAVAGSNPARPTRFHRTSLSIAPGPFAADGPGCTSAGRGDDL